MTLYLTIAALSSNKVQNELPYIAVYHLMIDWELNLLVLKNNMCVLKWGNICFRMQFPTPQSWIFLCFWQSGLTPIHVAAFMGHENIVTQLTNHGASPNTMNVVSTAIPNPTSTKQTVLQVSFWQWTKRVKQNILAKPQRPAMFLSGTCHFLPHWFGLPFHKAI